MANDRAERKSLRDEIKYKPEPPRFERRTFLTDVEQRRINLEIDERYHVKLESKRYRPGDPEFAAIAAQCKPIEQISNHNRLSGFGNPEQIRRYY